jgi:flagellar hook-associated protein 3 FlgL
MRVTTSSFPNTLRSQLERLSTQQARLQTQAGTGQRFSIASEDPRAMRKVLDLQSEIKTLSQYEKNIGTLQDTLTASYTAIAEVKKVSDRAGEIATRADGLHTPEELHSLGTEVDQLLEQTLQLANSQHQRNYLFGGTKNTTPPYVATRDAATGKITGITFNGTSSVSQAEIAEGITIAVSVPGSNPDEDGNTGTTRGFLKDDSSGADFFAHLISLRNNLDDANPAAVARIRQSDLPNLLTDEDNFLYHFANVGAIQSRLETAGSLANQRSISLESLVSKESDADLSQTLVALSQIQNAYTAALKTGGTILNQSLLDYIR